MNISRVQLFRFARCLISPPLLPWSLECLRYCFRLLFIRLQQKSICQFAVGNTKKWDSYASWKARIMTFYRSSLAESLLWPYLLNHSFAHFACFLDSMATLTTGIEYSLDRMFSFRWLVNVVQLQYVWFLLPAVLVSWPQVYQRNCCRWLVWKIAIHLLVVPLPPLAILVSELLKWCGDKFLKV